LPEGTGRSELNYVAYGPGNVSAINEITSKAIAVYAGSY
jgi:hypothetical protein